MNKKVIVFDLDGTLAQSKQKIDREMCNLLEELIKKQFFIAIMSGGSFLQYKNQLLPYLNLENEQLKKIILLPTSGATMYVHDGRDWQIAYQELLKDGEIKSIKSALEKSMKLASIEDDKKYGDVIENRGTQITFSGLGQNAPLSEKMLWDPNQQKRKKIVFYFLQILDDFNIQIGGTTSIDITKKNIDKSFGIHKLSDQLKIRINDMVFVGDSLFPGGNDEPVRKSGIDCVSVKSVEETKRYLKILLQK